MGRGRAAGVWLRSHSFCPAMFGLFSRSGASEDVASWLAEACGREGLHSPADLGFLRGLESEGRLKILGRSPPRDACRVLLAAMEAAKYQSEAVVAFDYARVADSGSARSVSGLSSALPGASASREGAGAASSGAPCFH